MMNRTLATPSKKNSSQSNAKLRFNASSPSAPSKPSFKPKAKPSKKAELPFVDWDKVIPAKKATSTAAASGGKPTASSSSTKAKASKKPARHQLETLEPTKRSINSKRSAASTARREDGKNTLPASGIDKFKRPTKVALPPEEKKNFARRDEMKMSRQRLNKLIATATTHSRRKVDELILQGRVKLNGQTVRELGTIVEEPHKARVEISGVAVRLQIRMKTIVMNKPKDCLTTRKDPQGRKTVYDLLPKEYHDLIPVGRLDRNSTGLLIMTNDGDLVQQLTHPKYHLPKVYRVILDRPVEDEERLANRFIEGIWFEEEGQFAKAIELIMVSPTEWGVVLESGMNRQIRRMFAACSYDVVGLKRIAIGDFEASGLMVGQFKELRYNDVQQLRRMLKRQIHQQKQDATMNALNDQLLAAAAELGI
jgi:23S rRNA pseudouridine2605 synthase